jgi:hypothetical protein
MYEIVKAPDNILSNISRGSKRQIPVEKMKVGEMIVGENTTSQRTKFYAAIKARRLQREIDGWEFRTKRISDTEIACIRIK